MNNGSSSKGFLPEDHIVLLVYFVVYTFQTA